METLILARISELLRYRQWWRRNRWADWPDIRREHEIELRALVRLARQARKVESPDPLTLYKSYMDWSQGELQEAFGR